MLGNWAIPNISFPNWFWNWPWNEIFYLTLFTRVSVLIRWRWLTTNMTTLWCVTAGYPHYANTSKMALWNYPRNKLWNEFSCLTKYEIKMRMVSYIFCAQNTLEHFGSDKHINRPFFSWSKLVLLTTINQINSKHITDLIYLCKQNYLVLLWPAWIW